MVMFFMSIVESWDGQGAGQEAQKCNIETSHLDRLRVFFLIVCTVDGFFQVDAYVLFVSEAKMLSIANQAYQGC